MSIMSTVQRWLRRLRLLAPLDFDQQVWGAKSLMDLHQDGSLFYLAEVEAGGTMYTCWQGSRDSKPYAITISSSGKSTGPTLDDSRVGDCGTWAYPPKLSCVQAQAAMAKAGITGTWTYCRLRKSVDYRFNPFYDFVFHSHAPVRVDAMTGAVDIQV